MRPTTGDTLAWAVACERDQWDRAIAEHVNVAPRHLTVEAETLFSVTLIHEVTRQIMDEKLGRIVTRVVLPYVIMHSRYHYGAFSKNFTWSGIGRRWRTWNIREAEGYCPIVIYCGDVPQWARYFPQANKGGQSTLANYCTYFVAYCDGSCIDINSARMLDRMLGEVRGSISRCIASSLVRNGFVRGSKTQRNGCYQHSCINMTLEVAVDGIWKAGGLVQFPGFNGELICSAYHELCSVNPLLMSRQCPNRCNSNVDCVDGKCICFLGFDGHDCSKRPYPSNCNGHGKCLKNSICVCTNGFTGIDCSTAICDEQCSLHSGVCDNRM